MTGSSGGSRWVGGLSEAERGSEWWRTKVIDESGSLRALECKAV